MFVILFFRYAIYWLALDKYPDLDLNNIEPRPFIVEDLDYVNMRFIIMLIGHFKCVL